MIRTITEKEKMILTDDSDGIVKDKTLGKEMVETVLKAMQAGLTEFTVPTKGDDDRRISWKVRNFVVNDADGLRIFKAAYIEDSPHCEILGPIVKPSIAAPAVDPANLSEADLRKAKA